MEFKNFRVPSFLLGKDIKVRPHELLVINTPTFQRLYNIKQLGLACLVYPFATHTRASHCLDCMDVAQMIVDALVANLKEEKRTSEANKVKNNEELIRMAALLHDIMHIPYSHTLEDENSIFERGDKSERINKMINKVKEELPKPGSSEFGALGIPQKEDYDKVKNYLDEVRSVLWTIALHKDKNRKLSEKKILKPEDYYIADIIGNTISADLLSYIIRDVDYTGIEKRPGPWYRLFDYLTLANDKNDGRKRLAIRITKGGIRHDVISAILGILDVRYALTEVVIYHHAKCAASAMLGKIAYLCKLTESAELYSIGDEGLFKKLEEKIKDLGEEDKDAVKKLLENLKSRRLYKRIYKVTVDVRKSYDKDHTPKLADKYKLPSERAKIEEEIERELDLPKGSIIIFCPSSKMALKEASVMVIYDKMGEVGVRSTPKIAVELNGEEFEEDYRDIFERVKNIEAQYFALWNMYVFLNSEKFLYAAIIQEKLKKKLEVKNDDQFQLYLEEKEEYKLGKEFVQAIEKQQTPTPADVFGMLKNRVAARGSVRELTTQDINDIVKTTMMESLSRLTKKNSESLEEVSTLFPDEKLSKKNSK